MRSILKVLGVLAAVVFLAAVAYFIYVNVRGGLYPSYAAANFPRLSAPDNGGELVGDLVAQTAAGTLRGKRVGSALVSWAFHTRALLWVLCVGRLPNPHPPGKE